MATERVFAGVGTFTQPVLMLQEPGGARWYVVEQGGRVFVFDNQPGVSSRREFINLSSTLGSATGGEMGLLGMVFHPSWPTDPRVYFSHNDVVRGQRVTRVVEYLMNPAGAITGPRNGRTILQVYQPQANHNGGHIAFGPDGYLYIGRGDGGGGGDPFGATGNAQRTSTLLGKLLRIDVNASTGPVRYAIPPGNPFAGNLLCNEDQGLYLQACPEIYAFGLRNPWRWSFDSASGELWLGDVGQGTREEINRIVAGGNYGWRCYEGTLSFNPDCGPFAEGAMAPVAEYGRTAGYSVTGGYVYRGTAVPQLSGRYVFGDFGSGRIWNIARDTAPTLEVTDGFESRLAIASFAEDTSRELYIVDYGGTLHRLVTASSTSGGPPSQLSASGCVNMGNPAQPAAGLIPYAPNAPFWSDGADKQRHLAVPDGQRIGIAADGDLEFPSGTVLVQHLRLGAQLVETRLLMRHSDGGWAGYTYEWNAAGTDAVRVVGGKTVQKGGQSWHFPSEAECMACHTEAAGRTLGLELAQLNGAFTYAATGRTANQMATLQEIGLFTAPPAQPPAQWPSLPDPYGSTGTLEQRARAWLHTNCAGCHRPGGPTGTGLDLRYSTPLAQTNACDTVPVRDLGVAGARIIAVGGGDAASRSLLVLRAGREDAEAMPPILPRKADAAGVALLTSWVNALTGCN